MAPTSQGGWMLDLLQPAHSSGSHHLPAASTGHGASLPSPAQDSGCLAALSQHRHHINPEGTLKMPAQPRPRQDRPKLPHPQRCLSNWSWSLPKKSYCFLLKLKDRENWLLPWSSEQLHITPLVVEAVLKLLRRCVLLKRCILAAPFPAFISLLPSRCRTLRSASALWFAFPPSYQPQTAAALPVWTEINPNLLCVSVGAELPLLSRLQMHSPVIQSSAYSQL